MPENEPRPNNSEEEIKPKKEAARTMDKDEWEEFEVDLEEVEITQGHEQDLKVLKELRRTIAEEDKKTEEDEEDKKG